MYKFNPIYEKIVKHIKILFLSLLPRICFCAHNTPNPLFRFLLNRHFRILLHADATMKWSHATALTVTYNGTRNIHGSTAFSAATGHQAPVSFSVDHTYMHDGHCMHTVPSSSMQSVGYHN
jgi:hypothetical protein